MNEYWQNIFNRRMLICVFTGFASGMPLYVLIQLVPAWLRSEGVGLKEIGFFTLIGLPYTWKFLWAPLLDRYWVNNLGRRRTWLIASQLPLIASIAALPFFSTETDLWLIAYMAAVVAFFSATQDIAIDALRREILPDKELGMGSTIHANAYRAAGLIPGGLSLIMADHLPWTQVFPITAVFMIIGVGMTVVVKEPQLAETKALNFSQAVTEPFKEFFTRNGVKHALMVLAFMFLYKLGDNLAVSLQTPFFIDLGFTKTEIGTVAKLVGFWASVIGGFAGGMLMIKIGINRGLWVFGAVQILSILGFALLAKVGTNLTLLGVVMGFEYLGVGLGAAALLAFIARSTSKLHTATQLALLTALTAVPRTIANASTGIMVEVLGWEHFFYVCTLLAIPGMLMLFKVAPWNGDDSD